MIRNLWPLLIGFTIWAVAFLVIYAVQALGCVWSWPEPWHRSLLIAITLLTFASLATSLGFQLRGAKIGLSGIKQAGVILTAITLPISLVVFGPTAFLSMCL